MTDPGFVIPPERTFDGLLGLEVLEVTEERATARLAVREDLKQVMGLLHGGVLCSIAESLASIATAVWVMNDGQVAQGLSNQTSFTRPLLEGTVHAEAIRRHRGRTTWVWDVELSDDRGRLCALSRMTIAVRPRPQTSPSPER